MAEIPKNDFSVDGGKIKRLVTAGLYREALDAFPTWIKDPIVAEMRENIHHDVVEQVVSFERIDQNGEEVSLVDFNERAVRSEILTLLDFHGENANKRESYRAAAKLIADQVAYTESVQEADAAEFEAMEFRELQPEAYEEAFESFKQYQKAAETGVDGDFIRWEAAMDDTGDLQKSPEVSEIPTRDIDRSVSLAKEVFDRKNKYLNEWLLEIEAQRQVPTAPEFSVDYFASRRTLERMSGAERDELEKFFLKKQRIALGAREKIDRRESDIFKLYTASCQREKSKYHHAQKSKKFGHLVEYVLLDMLSLPSFLSKRHFKRVLKSSPVEDFFRGSDLMIQADDDVTWISIDVTTGKKKLRGGARLPNLGAMIYDERNGLAKGKISPMSNEKRDFSESFSVIGVDHSLDKGLMLAIATDYIEVIKSGKCQTKKQRESELMNILAKYQFDSVAWAREIEKALAL